MNTNHTKAAPVDLGVSAPSGDRRYPSTTKLKGSTIMSEEAHPIDNPGPLKMGDGIPAADLDGLIQATVPADDSRCPFRWCAPACNGVNHSWSQYVTARLGHVDTGCNQIDNIGAGVSWSTDEETVARFYREFGFQVSAVT